MMPLGGQEVWRNLTNGDQYEDVDSQGNRRSLPGREIDQTNSVQEPTLLETDGMATDVRGIAPNAPPVYALNTSLAMFLTRNEK